jgi:hypothetical protein
MTGVITPEYLRKHGMRRITTGYAGIRNGEMLEKFNKVGISGSHAAGIKGPS